MVDLKGFIEEMDIDMEMASEMYEIFSEELAEERDQLFSDWQAADMDNFFRTLHNIKGISATYRANDVHHLIQSIYDAEESQSGKARQFSLMKEEDLQKISKVVEDTLQEIQSYFQASP